MTVSRLTGALALIVFGTLHGQQRPPAPSDAFTNGIERYARGEFAAIVAALSTAEHLERAVKEFQSAAERWIAAGEDKEKPQRLAVAATIVLDLAGRAVAQEFDPHGESFRVLLEWMCARLRQMPRSEFERVFHLASMSLLQAADDEELLIATRYTFRTVVPQAHILHGAERFPEDSRFKLAWITMRYETVLIASEPLAPGYLLNMGAGRFEADGGATRSLNDTLAVLTKLVDDPAVGAEARLRRGVLQFLMDRPAEAAGDLEPLSTSTDAFIRYNARMILGAIASRANRMPTAEAHYRDAYAAVPATTVTTALAATLFLQGRTTDAADLLATTPPMPSHADPWFQYGQRDYRLFPDYLDQMRAMVTERR